MGNEARVKKEIHAAVERLSISDLPPELVEKVAMLCVDLESAHQRNALNIVQQFEQLLRELGAKSTDEVGGGKR